MNEQKYYIASLKHTNKYHEHILFWGPDSRGYTPVFGEYIGQYAEAEAVTLNDGDSYIAVACEVVERLQSPEPYGKPGERFYDQRGPVVDNTRDKWNQLITESLKLGRTHKPKPEPFRGKRRAIYTQASHQEMTESDVVRDRPIA